MKDCPFCNIDQERIIQEYEFFNVIRDLYPVTEGHTLIIPKRYVESFFELTNEESKSLIEILSEQREKLMLNDKSISGFNIGINDGKDAGQTIMHCHVHLIPRRQKDVEDPRGGVRGVIPEKQKY